MVQWRTVRADRPRQDGNDTDWYLTDLCSDPTPPLSASQEVGLASESGLVNMKVS